MSYGSWLIYPPAGFITGGLLLIVGALLISLGSRAAILAQICDVQSAREQTVRLAEAKSPIAYGAVLVSAIVLVGFAVMLWLVIREEVPAHQRDMVTLLLGTLAGMASSVVAYWVGSSNGSMQKNTVLEKALAQK